MGRTPVLGVGLALLALAAAPPGAWAKGRRPPAHLVILSKAFLDGGRIPVKYTCDGEGLSPELHWKGLPHGTKSLALIVDDPDAPYSTWTHWVAYNIPPDVLEFLEDFPKDGELPNGIAQGMNDFKALGWGAPCPPSGTHRYFFRLYALDSRLDLDPGATAQELRRAMKGHILSMAQMMGRYGQYQP